MRGICEFCGADLHVAKHDGACKDRWKLPPHEKYPPTETQERDRSLREFEAEISRIGMVMAVLDRFIKYPNSWVQMDDGRTVQTLEYLKDVYREYEAKKP